jgi:hypothetical protein
MLRWQLSLGQRDDKVRRESLGVQPTLGKVRSRREVCVVAFGCSRVDPCDQRVDLRLESAGQGGISCSETLSLIESAQRAASAYVISEDVPAICPGR